MVAGQAHTLPARTKHGRQNAGQGTHSTPCLQDRMVAGQAVREHTQHGNLHTHSLPTRPAWSRTYTEHTRTYIRTKKHTLIVKVHTTCTVLWRIPSLRMRTQGIINAHDLLPFP